MLVLSRKLSQQVMIGPDIRITIVKLERNQVRLGIEAPETLPFCARSCSGRAKPEMALATSGTNGRGLSRSEWIRECALPLSTSKSAAALPARSPHRRHRDRSSPRTSWSPFHRRRNSPSNI